MSKRLVAYFSASGVTAKVAENRNRPAKARPQKDKRHPTQNRVPHFVMQSFPE